MVCYSGNNTSGSGLGFCTFISVRCNVNVSLRAFCDCVRVTTSILCFLLFKSMLQMIRGVSLENVFAWFAQTYVQQIWQSKCFCSRSRLRHGWFHRNNSLWRRNKTWKRRCFLSLWVALETGTWKKYTKTEGSWQCFVKAENDKLKRKASKPGGRGGNAKRRIIRKEIYCTYSKAVTPCLLQESNAILIKEVNHFSRALTYSVIAFSKVPNQVVIKNFICQSVCVQRQKILPMCLLQSRFMWRRSVSWVW